MLRSAISVFILTLLLTSCVAIATRSDKPGYTQAFVEDAIRFYNENGRQAAVDYYSSTESLDGPWYVFILGEDGHIIAHYNPNRIGIDHTQLVDPSGYFYGDDILSATEAGKWVSYIFLNPDTGEEQRKHSWIVRYDGLHFGAGWYEDE